MGSDKLYAHFGMAGHNGTDLRAGEQPIYAACTVIEKQTVPARGLGLGILTDETVFLDQHGTHFAKLRYWHLKSFDVEVGQHVKEGDIIGITDNTGFSSADHLHFELQPMDKDAGGHPVLALADSGTDVIDSSIDPEPFFCGIYADIVQEQISAWQKILLAAKQLAANAWAAVKGPNVPYVPPSGVGMPDMPATASAGIPSALQRVYASAFASIGQDLSRSAPNEVGCAESLSRVLKTVYPDFPIILSTTELNAYLKSSPHFRVALYPQVGCATIFPTNGASVGHCGIWGKNHVMSNSSATGKWEPNYLHDEWYRAADKRGLPLFHYIPL